MSQTPEKDPQTPSTPATPRAGKTRETDPGSTDTNDGPKVGRGLDESDPSEA